MPSSVGKAPRCVRTRRSRENFETPSRSAWRSRFSSIPKLEGSGIDWKCMCLAVALSHDPVRLLVTSHSQSQRPVQTGLRVVSHLERAIRHPCQSNGAPSRLNIQSTRWERDIHGPKTGQYRRSS